MKEQIGGKICAALQMAGISKGDDGYGLQYNLAHASLSEFGNRNGLDPRLIPILEEMFPENYTEEAKIQQHQNFIQSISRILASIKPMKGVQSELE